MIFCTLIVIFGLILIKYLYEKHTYWKKRNVTEILNVPFFGFNWYVFFRNYSIQEVYQYAFDKYPNIRYYGLYDFFNPIIVIKDPELMKEICIESFHHFSDHFKGIPSDDDKLWNRNLLHLDGEEWKEMRKILSPSFSSGKMKLLFLQMKECADNVSLHFKNYKTVHDGIIKFDVNDTFTRYTNDIIANVVFGISCNSLKNRNDEFYMKGSSFQDFSGIWRNFKFALIRVYPWFSKVFETSIFNKDITKFFRNIIRENIEFREKFNIDRVDMIALMMQAFKGKENLEISEEKLEDITAQASLFFLGGYGSIASVSGFLAYELALNPDIQQKVIEEIDEIKKEQKDFSYGDIGKLNYLDMVISETLRKWPAFVRGDRICSKPYTIQPVRSDEKPLHISKGQLCWIPMYSLHHDEKYWDEPSKFNPERFSPENKDKIKVGSYLPFSIGPRFCIGARFAIIEIKVLFFILLSEFKFVTIEETVIPCELDRTTSISMPKHKLWLGLKSRSNENCI